MSSKVHSKNGNIRIKNNMRREVYDDDEIIKTTYWRSKNPKVSKVKYKNIVLTNRFDFGKDAPYRVRNFLWLRKDRKIKDYFGVDNNRKA